MSEALEVYSALESESARSESPVDGLSDECAAASSQERESLSAKEYRLTLAIDFDFTLVQSWETVSPFTKKGYLDQIQSGRAHIAPFRKETGVFTCEDGTLAGSVPATKDSGEYKAWADSTPFLFYAPLLKVCFELLERHGILSVLSSTRCLMRCSYDFFQQFGYSQMMGLLDEAFGKGRRYLTRQQVEMTLRELYEKYPKFDPKPVWEAINWVDQLREQTGGADMEAEHEAGCLATKFQSAIASFGNSKNPMLEAIFTLFRPKGGDKKKLICIDDNNAVLLAADMDDFGVNGVVVTEACPILKQLLIIIDKLHLTDELKSDLQLKCPKEVIEAAIRENEKLRPYLIQSPQRAQGAIRLTRSAPPSPTFLSAHCRIFGGPWSKPPMVVLAALNSNTDVSPKLSFFCR